MHTQLEHASARSLLANLLACCFSDPTPEFLAALEDDTVRDEVETALRVLGISIRPFRELLATVQAFEELSVGYAALFGHAVRGDCPLYEMEYARGEIFQQSHRLADVAGFYRAFGLCTDDTRCERVDHVAAEWEFLAVCAAKQALAEAWSAGLDAPPSALNPPAAAASCIEAQVAFIRDHVATWMPAFFNRVRTADADGYFGRCASLGEAVLRHWCECLNVAYGPEWLELRPDDEEDLAIECGPGREPGQVTLGPRLTAALEGA